MRAAVSISTKYYCWYYYGQKKRLKLTWNVVAMTIEKAATVSVTLKTCFV